MSLVVSALLPHCPLLHPNIGPEGSTDLQATRAALQAVARECYSAKISTVVIIAPHEPNYEHAVGILGTPKVSSEYLAFGDGVSREDYAVNVALVAHLVEHARQHELPVSLLPFSNIHYGASIPLLSLRTLLPGFNIVVISPPHKATTDELLAFGFLLREVISESSARVALIASADLAHTLSKQSHLPFDAKATSTQNHLIHALETLDSGSLFNVHAEQMVSTGLCGFAPIAMLVGALANTNPHIAMLSYEMLDGVGYAVAVYSYARRV